MSRRVFTVFCDPDRWAVACAAAEKCAVASVPAPPEAALSTVANLLAESLRNHGYRGEGLVLALPSAWCLCATLSLAPLPRKPTREAMLYGLEEKLPLAAEEVVADFIPQGQQALGVAVAVQRLEPLVQALEQRGVAVQVICPASLLSIAALSSSLAPYDLLIWEDGGRRELFYLANGSLQGWWLLSQEPQDLLLQLRILGVALGKPLRVGAAGLDDPTRSLLAGAEEVGTLGDVDASLAEAAARAAPALLDGSKRPLVNLRRDALAIRDRWRQIRSPLNCALTALILLLACCIGVLWWRAQGYGRVIQRVEDQQRGLFQQAFPGQSLPVNIKSRLSSEERRLAAINPDAGADVAQASALGVLQDLLEALPRDMRYRILEIRCTCEKLYLEGQVRSHGDADALAAALRKQAGFQIESPRTEQLPAQGVGLTLAGMVIQPPGPSPKP